MNLFDIEKNQNYQKAKNLTLNFESITYIFFNKKSISKIKNTQKFQLRMKN